MKGCFPAPTQIFETLMYKFANKAPDGNVLWVNILASLQVALSGFLAAIIIGVPLGLVMGWWTYADRFIRPIFELVRPVPPIAWIPPGSGVDGNWAEGKGSHYLFYRLCAMRHQFLYRHKADQQDVNQCIQDLGASNAEIFWKVGVPSSLPHGICRNPRGIWEIPGPPWWRRRCWQPARDWDI